MRAKKLGDRINFLKQASQFQHKLIDSIISIMSLKKKAQVQYRSTLQQINHELQKFIISDYGFITDIVTNYKSYICVLYDNQTSLIDSYDTEVLPFLAKAKDHKLEDQIIQKVQFVDKKVEEFQDSIRKYKKLIKQNQDDLNLNFSQVAFRTRMKDLKEDQKKKYAQSVNDLKNIKKINQETLEHHVDGLMELTSMHYQTVKLLNQYETSYLQEKASSVYDRFIQAFIGQVLFMSSMQSDIQKILGNVNENKNKKKKITYQNLMRKIEENKGFKDSLIGVYKKWTTPQISIDINEHYISQKIRDKWKRICEHYNEQST